MITEKQRELRRARYRRYYESHKEQMNARWRAYYYRSKDKINPKKNAKRNAAYVHHPRTPLTEEEKRTSRKVTVRKYYLRNKERLRPHKRAYKVFHYALKTGFIVRATFCFKCGIKSKRLDAHHPDYSKPLEVVWLCKKCHSAIHNSH